MGEVIDADGVRRSQVISSFSTRQVRRPVAISAHAGTGFHVSVFVPMRSGDRRMGMALLGEGSRVHALPCAARSSGCHEKYLMFLDDVMVP